MAGGDCACTTIVNASNWQGAPLILTAVASCVDNLPHVVANDAVPHQSRIRAQALVGALGITIIRRIVDIPARVVACLPRVVMQHDACSI